MGLGEVKSWCGLVAAIRLLQQHGRVVSRVYMCSTGYALQFVRGALIAAPRPIRDPAVPYGTIVPYGTMFFTLNPEPLSH